MIPAPTFCSGTIWRRRRYQREPSPLGRRMAGGPPAGAAQDSRMFPGTPGFRRWMSPGLERPELVELTSFTMASSWSLANST